MEIVLKSDIDVTLINKMGADSTLAMAAWVSTSSEDGLKRAIQKPEDVVGVINYLMKHRHGTPFEHSCLQFYIRAPIFVWREWHRHRIGMCLAGDTKITLGSWTRTRTIAEIYRNWHEGVPDSRPFKNGQGICFDSQTRKWRVQVKKDNKTLSLGRFKTYEEALETRKQWDQENPTFRIRHLPSCVNLKARVLNEDSHLFTTGIMADVYKSGIKEVYSVTTEKGHNLKASRDHRILTQDGWATVSELKIGDRIAVAGKRSKFAERQIPPALRNGIGVWTSMQRNRLIREEDKCYICNFKFLRNDLCLDHVIPVTSDISKALDISNLKPICNKCHRIKTNGEQKLARRGCVAGSKFVKLIETPKLVGEEMTYDIEMEGPYHNFVANKIVVHNSYNEESARYKTLDPVFYVANPERPSKKIENWKPGRPKFTLDKDLNETVNRRNIEVYKIAYNNYLANLNDGCDPGFARNCLPVGIYSACWFTCNPRSLMHFLSLRTHEKEAAFVSYPLYEIELAARTIEKIFAEHWPITYQAFNKNNRVAP